eukprot:GHVU01073587.1.p1 GENE.GHVU01073587.1~~GHVU01073587.1.p1  ORF type:complete len:154 (-),score=12.24 GHVU01073587.1:546-1007(-)
MRGSSRAVLLSTDYGKMTLVEVVDTRRNTLENAKTSDSATVTLHVLNTAANKYSDVFTELVKGKLNPDSEDVLVFLQPENNVIVPLEHPKASETHPKVISVLLADEDGTLWQFSSLRSRTNRRDACFAFVKRCRRTHIVAEFNVWSNHATLHH